MVQYESGISLGALGKIYGVSDMTIRARLVEQGIKIRTHAESARLPDRITGLSEAKMGSVPWNKGLSADQDQRVRKYVENRRGWKASAETRRKISLSRQKHTWYDVCQVCGRNKG
jgi:hypothetical protein